MFSKIEGQIYFFCGLSIVLICLLVFWINPHLDLDISHLFYDEAEGFTLSKIAASIFFRKLFIWLMVLFYVVVTWCGIKAYKEQKPAFKLDWDRWAFLGACGLLGPTLLVNVLLKGNWGRARPRNVSEFGNVFEYTQFWTFTDQCDNNCSFASGEVTSTAMIFISLSIVVFWPKRYLVMVIGAVVTALVAWMRMSVGAHFFTDCLVGVGLMLMVAPLVYLLFDTPNRGWIKNLSDIRQLDLDAKK